MRATSASNQSMKPSPKVFARHGGQAEHTGPITIQVDSFAPARSAFGLPIYVASLPAGSIRRTCHDTLDFIQVSGFPSAIRVFALTHSRRNVVQR
jgi:hypothetical protein